MNTLSIIVIVIAIIGILAFIGWKLYTSIKLVGLKGTAIQLIVDAENAFNYGMNDEKFNSVFDGVYALLPDVVKAFISKETVVKFIQKTFTEIKSALDNEPKIEESKEG